MKFYQYNMVLDGKRIGEMISPLEDKEQVINQWLDKVPRMISIKIREIREKDPDAFDARRTGEDKKEVFQ